MREYIGHRAMGLQSVRETGREVAVMESVAQLQKEVRDAVARRSKIRVVAMSMSPQLQRETLAAHADPSVRFLTLHNSTRFTRYRMEQDAAGTKWVTAGAAIQLGKAPSEETDVQSVAHLGELLWADGLSMPNQVGSMVPSLGGVLLVGGDGGSLSHQMSSMVWGMRFVDGTGALRELWRNDTSSDDFTALRVNMGLIGIVYEFILKPEPAFCLKRAHMAQQWTMSPRDPSVDAEEGSVVPASPRFTALVDEIAAAEYGRVIYNLFSRPLESHAFRSTMARLVQLSIDSKMSRTPAEFDPISHSWRCASVPGTRQFAGPEHEFISLHAGMGLGVYIRMAAHASCFDKDARAEQDFWPRLLASPVVLEWLLHTRHLALHAGSNATTAVSPAAAAAAQQTVELCLQKLLQLSWDEVQHTVSAMDNQFESYISCAGVRVGYSGAAAAASGALEDGATASTPFHVGPAFALLPLDGIALIKHHPLDFSELFIELDDSGRRPKQSISFVLGVLERMAARDPRLQGASIGNFEVYFARGDPAWMSPAYSPRGRQARFLRFNIMQSRLRQYGSDEQDDAQFFFAQGWKALTAAGVDFRLHWGKHLPARPQHERILCGVRRQHDQLHAWRARVQASDPHAIFRDAYWQRVLFDKLEACPEL
jgi:hypothetical protein